MQFSSGKHEKITGDPAPWVCRDTKPGDPPDGRFEDDCGDDRFDPRPEFARPLTNPVNPILYDFRENCLAWSLEDAEDYLKMLASLDTEYYRTPTGRAQITHAQRVLRRLSNLT